MAVPQTPLTGTAPVEQAVEEVLVPPFRPLQPQVQGPEPLTVVAIPAEQRFVEGAEERLAPFEDPQEPLVMRLAEQLAVVPLYWPVQLQVQGPEPETEEAVPMAQRLELGIELKLAPFEDPQEPFIGIIPPVAQLAEDPPLVPLQPQVQGPEPETEEAVPMAQRLVEGAEEKVCPFDDPQTPLVKTVEPEVIESVEQS